MNVRQARQELKKTLKEVADAVDTDVGNLSRIERGQVPGRELAERLISFYEGRISWASFYETPEPSQQEAA